MTRLSAIIITKNEESNLPRLLKSIAWADEIVVVDSHSQDQTVAIAKQFGAQVHQMDWIGFGPAKRAAADFATGDWLLSVDADEEVTPELAAEIQSAVQGNGDVAGYYIPRRTSFLGRWIYHCGWYPDPVLRLFRKENGTFDDALVHERVNLIGQTGRLQNELLHYSYPDLELYLEKLNRYTSLGAEEAWREGKRAGLMQILVKPPVTFAKHYLVKKGFLDGIEGFILSALSAMSVLVKYAKLRQLSKSKDHV